MGLGRAPGRLLGFLSSFGKTIGSNGFSDDPAGGLDRNTKSIQGLPLGKWSVLIVIPAAPCLIGTRATGSLLSGQCRCDQKAAVIPVTQTLAGLCFDTDMLDHQGHSGTIFMREVI